MATTAARFSDFDVDAVLARVERGGTSAPKMRPAPAPQRHKQPRLVRVKPRSKEDQQADAKRRIKAVAKILCVSMVLLTLLGLYIYTKVLLNEYNTKYETLSTQYAEAVSENVRLTSEVTAKYSVGNIAAYAEDQLGMIKKSDYQINYFRVD